MNSNPEQNSGSAVGPKTSVNSSPPVSGNKSIGGSDQSTATKYLTTPVAPTPTSKHKLPRARLLTSSESLTFLEEKERKKREETELKEKRKIERAEKK